MNITLLACIVLSSGPAALAENDSLACTLYHADPHHLWNRLHAVLFIRVGPDDRTYGEDRIEPLLWPCSKYLLDGETHHRAVSLLQEFINQHGEKLIDDPLKRAILQRDLWLVFNCLTGEHPYFEEPAPSPEQALAAQDRLSRLLAAVINRLALSPQQIHELPDNYAAAAESGDFAARFDPSQPDRAYLPRHLFAEEGPWVCVGRSDGPTAPQHLREDGTNRFTNSVFLVFLRLPAGREATVTYLDQIGSFSRPLFIPNPQAADRTFRPFMPNPALPQFPKGTELALVRQAMLIDSSHQILPSPITESIQLRVVQEDVPNATPEVLEDAFRATSARHPRADAWQSSHELRLTRRGLFENRAGGLWWLGRDEQDFKTGFNAHHFDVFEMPLSADEPFSTWNRRPVVRQLCAGCHTLPGVFSFSSLQDFRSGLNPGGDQLRPFPLKPMPVSEVAAAAIHWKESQSSWKALEALLTER